MNYNCCIATEGQAPPAADAAAAAPAKGAKRAYAAGLLKRGGSHVFGMAQDLSKKTDGMLSYDDHSTT